MCRSDAHLTQRLTRLLVGCAQVARSKDGLEWSRFKALSIDRYNLTQGDIYFWAAQTNPAHNTSLVAIFPVVHQLQGCIGIAFSIDGQRWSRWRHLGCPHLR